MKFHIDPKIDIFVVQVVQCNDNLFHGSNIFDTTCSIFQGVTPETLDDQYDFLAKSFQAEVLCVYR